MLSMFLFLQIQYVLAAPGVLAEVNIAKGQAAFDACVKTQGQSASFVCQSVRQKAIQEDIAARFKVLIKYLYSGHNTNNVHKAWATAKMKLQ